MRVVLAVIIDLFSFLRGLWRSVPVESVELLTAPLSPTLLPPLHPAKEQIVLITPPNSASPKSPKGLSVGEVQYVNNHTYLFHDPTLAFDNAVAKLPYGTPLTPIRRSGRFVYVDSTYGTGWVDADTLASFEEVVPRFSIGQTYTADHGDTQKLRACIDDDFLGAATQLPLSGVEYVTYRLYQAGRKIVWPEHWGRVAGSWQRKLRGVKGVRMDVLPHTGAVMEYIIDDVGFVAFVEAVSPANRITISGIGLVHEGQYTEERLEHATWRELRPVFISVL